MASTMIINHSLSSFFFLLTLTTLHARESQFFAKVSNNLPTTTTPRATADGGAYGLYGHDSGQLPPSTTTTTLPENYNPVAYTTPLHSNTQEELDEPAYNPDSTTYNSEQHVGTNDGGMYNSHNQGGGGMYIPQMQGDKNYNYGSRMYNPEKQGDSAYNYGSRMYNPEKQGGAGEAMLMENGGYNNGGATYNTIKQENVRYNPGSNMYNTEKQGMSDTRFLENGKYYYDLNSENLSARYGNNIKGYYYGNNNDNSYERFNSNEGYQNQQEEEQFNP